jgi:predicted flap endonuclease-1-like 5' DNA nuclease
MSSLLSSLGCCFWWFLAGALLGWLLNRCLCKCCCKAPPTSGNTAHTSAAPAKMADVPATPVAKVAPVVATTPKTATPKNVAPKATAPAVKVAATIDLVAAKKAGFAIKNANDLTVVEGIGPKINELFNNAGIKTFAQLAKATVPQMRKILDDGGSRFRIANPSTWAQQAALAADNKWVELKKLQDKLSAGLKK